ncbi:monovalent cation/H+ antiporter complex subunit F [Methylibium petroleiphilum]|uniref:monovalent cation/H+ antiporter complex subunit F n=1 Tax=Methylibium petroleiphilum TaxID=105560 RepID=UPI001AC5309B|nr:monovalent cation/H+ antiporter complex subunit F [Methylibium petroleiphilum]MBN9203652.1 cation:proton antiporter [Methylibium petroleiphilum]
MPEWTTAALWIAAAGVLATIALGLVRVERGPSNGDRMLAAQLLGTGAVAVLLLLARAADAPALLDVALVLALLASVAGAVFVRRIGVQPPERHREHEERAAEDRP